jgi:hypothetical protein
VSDTKNEPITNWAVLPRGSDRIKAFDGMNPSIVIRSKVPLRRFGGTRLRARTALFPTTVNFRLPRRVRVMLVALVENHPVNAEPIAHLTKAGGKKRLL